MLYIAYCGHMDLADSDEPIERLIEDVCADCGVENPIISCFENPLDLIDVAVNPKTAASVDIVICGMGISGITPLEIARDIRKEMSNIKIILSAGSASECYGALDLHIEGVLYENVTRARFCGTLSHVVLEVVNADSATVFLRARGGTRRIALADVLYAETSDHDQVIHMDDGGELRVRMSSQALFDILAIDGRFFKAGSSYILNTNKVRLVDSRDSSALLFGGVRVPVPMRVRKSLEKAILGDI